MARINGLFHPNVPHLKVWFNKKLSTGHPSVKIVEGIGTSWWSFEPWEALLPKKKKTLLNLTKMVYGWISNRLSSGIPFIVGKGGLPAVCSGGGVFCNFVAWCRYPVPKAKCFFKWNGGIVIEIKLLGEACINRSIHVWSIYIYTYIYGKCR